MADEDDSKSTAVSDEQAQPSGKRFSPVFGRPDFVNLGVRFLGNRVWINGVSVDGKPLGGSSAKVNKDSEIVFSGGGLDNLDFWELRREGRKPLKFSRIRSQSSNAAVLNLGDLEGALERGESFGVTFFSSKFGGRLRTLRLVFTYLGTTEEPESQGQGKVRSGGGAGETGTPAKGPGPVALVTEAAGTVISEAVKPFGPGAASATKPSAAQGGGAGSQGQTKKNQTDGLDAYDDGVEEIGQSGRETSAIAGGGVASGTQAVSTGAKVVSQGSTANVGAVSQTLTAAARTTSEDLRSASGGGTVAQSVSGQVSSGETQTSTTTQGGGVISQGATAVSGGGGAISQTVGGEISSGGTASVSGTAQAGGAIGGTVGAAISGTAQMSGGQKVSGTVQTPSAAVGEKVSGTITAQGGGPAGVGGKVDVLGTVTGAAPAGAAPSGPSASAKITGGGTATQPISGAVSSGGTTPASGTAQAGGQIISEGGTAVSGGGGISAAQGAPGGSPAPSGAPAATQTTQEVSGGAAGAGGIPSAEPSATQASPEVNAKPGQPPVQAPTDVKATADKPAEGEEKQPSDEVETPQPLGKAVSPEEKEQPDGKKSPSEKEEPVVVPVAVKQLLEEFDKRGQGKEPKEPLLPGDLTGEPKQKDQQDGKQGGLPGPLGKGSSLGGEAGMPGGPPSPGKGNVDGVSGPGAKPEVPQGPEVGQPLREFPKEKSANDGSPENPPSAEQPAGQEKNAGDEEAEKKTEEAGGDQIAARLAARAAAEKKTQASAAAEKIKEQAGKALRTQWNVTAIAAYGTIWLVISFYLAWGYMIGLWFAGNKLGEKHGLKKWQKGVTIASPFVPPVIVLLFIFLILIVGCNYAPTRAILLLSGGGKICEALDVSKLSGSSVFSGGGFGGGGASGGYCQPLSSGPASVANLSSTCFGSNAQVMSQIASVESSGGNALAESGSDRCKDGNSWSIGLFQINIIANGKLVGGACAGQIIQVNNSDGKHPQGDCLERNPKNNVCVKYDCQVVNQSLYTACKQQLYDPAVNISVACKLSNNGANLSPAWTTTAKLCGLIN